MAEVILDKSYLDGKVSNWRFREIHRQHTLLMTDPLLREMVTTQPKSMTRCFQSLPPGENPVVLIPEIGVLIEFEVKENTSCSPLLAKRLSANYTFNTGLREGTFSFENNQKEAVEEIDKHHGKTAQAFFRRSAQIPRLFPELRDFRPGQARHVVNRTMLRVASEPDKVREIYSRMKPDNYPDPSSIDGDWLLFRLLQAQLLGSIECFSRYEVQHFKCPPTKVEHFRQDIDYLALASLSGGLASRDKMLIEWFKILRPDGLLIT